MQAVTGITNQPAQIVNLTASDGSTVTLTLAYRPQQLGWFFDLQWNGTSPATEINGRRITAFPNLLRQFKNILTFGLACVTTDGLEPLGQDDFSTQYATILLLSPADVKIIEAVVFPGNTGS